MSAACSVAHEFLGLRQLGPGGLQLVRRPGRVGQLRLELEDLLDHLGAGVLRLAEPRPLALEATLELVDALAGAFELRLEPRVLAGERLVLLERRLEARLALLQLRDLLALRLEGRGEPRVLDPHGLELGGGLVGPALHLLDLLLHRGGPLEELLVEGRLLELGLELQLTLHRLQVLDELVLVGLQELGAGLHVPVLLHQAVELLAGLGDDALLLLGGLGADDAVDGAADELLHCLLVEHLDLLEPLLLEVREVHLLGARVEDPLEVEFAVVVAHGPLAL